MRDQPAAAAASLDPAGGLSGRIVSVNIGRPAWIDGLGERRWTAIDKRPVADPVPVTAEGLAGDGQADRRRHGGPNKAVYAYAVEDLRWWAEELDRPLPPGSFGENLTVAGLDVSAAEVGERWRIGEVELEVTGPRRPCRTLAVRFADPELPRRFRAAGRPGVYLRVRRGGRIAAGEVVVVVGRSGQGPTVAELAAR